MSNDDNIEARAARIQADARRGYEVLDNGMVVPFSHSGSMSDNEVVLDEMNRISGVRHDSGDIGAALERVFAEINAARAQSGREPNLIVITDGPGAICEDAWPTLKAAADRYPFRLIDLMPKPSIPSYGDVIKQAFTGKMTLTESTVRDMVRIAVLIHGPGEHGLDQSEAEEALANLPFAIANLVEDNRIEKVLADSGEPHTEAFVMHAHGANRYAFDLVHADEAAGKPRSATNPEWLLGAPRIVYSILKEGGVDVRLSDDKNTDPTGLGGTRLFVAIPQEAAA